MAATVKGGPRTWSLTTDRDGYRTYKVTFLVQTSSPLEGPSVASQAAGLPGFGDHWAIDADEDVTAFCTPERNVTPVYDQEKVVYYEVECTFTNKPLRLCSEGEIENPLAQPPRISIGYVSYTQEVNVDKDGLPILTSSHEPLRGAVSEFTYSHMIVRIVMNVAVLDLPTLDAMKDTVNATTLWGMPPRTVLMRAPQAERKFYGTCNAYYELSLEFETHSQGFDRIVQDEGAKVLNGHWNRQHEWVLDKVGVLGPPIVSFTFLENPEVGGGLEPELSFYYEVTSVDENGGETTPYAIECEIPNIVVDPVVIYLTWPAVEGAGAYRVYGRGPTPLGLNLLAEVTATGYTDDGSDVEGEELAPTENTTGVAPDPSNPRHFRQAVDYYNNPIRMTLNGEGLPANVVVGSGGGEPTDAGFVEMVVYEESDFTTLGIPLVL